MIWIPQLFCLLYLLPILVPELSLETAMKSESRNSKVVYFIFLTISANGLAERSSVNGDENNLLGLSVCSMRDLQGSTIHMSIKEVAKRTNGKLGILHLSTLSSTGLLH